MRDIRNDLKERLESLDAELVELRSQLEKAQEAREHLVALWTVETSKWAKFESLTSDGENLLQVQKGKAKSPLARLILEKLSDRKSHTLIELCKEAATREIPFGNKSPKRTLHMAILGLAKGGGIERVSRNNWRLK